jgi:DNA polymerase I-like protein with 3'-5' exonuclease and polymerase domains
VEILDNYLVVDIETSIGKVPAGTKLFGADCAHVDADPLLVGTFDGTDYEYYGLDSIGTIDFANKLVVGHNFSFDWSHLTKYCHDTSFYLWDTMIAEYLIQNQYVYDLYGKKKSLSLDALINAKSSDNSKHVAEMFKHGYGIDYILPHKAKEYLKADLKGTELLFKNQLESIREAHPDTFSVTVRYMLTQMTASLTTADMHAQGMSISGQNLGEMELLISNEIEHVASQLNDDLTTYSHIDIDKFGHDWMNSPTKVATVLYGGDWSYDEQVPTGTNYKTGPKAGTPKYKKEKVTKTHMGFVANPKSKRTVHRSTDAKTLTDLAAKYSLTLDWLLGRLLTLRELNKTKSTYLTGLTAHIYQDGKIHGNYAHARTATKRLASSRPNLQNLSNVSTTLSSGVEIVPKDVFIAPHGELYAEIDYSSLEVRVLALASNDANLIKYINDGVDMHRMFASRLYNKPESEVTDAERKLAKAFSFQLQYGATAKGIAKQWNQPEELVARFIDDYYREFPKVAQYHQYLLDCLSDNGSYLGHQQDNHPTMYSVLPSVWAYNGQRDLTQTHRHIGGFGMTEEVYTSKYGGPKVSFKPTVAKNYPIQGAAADIMNSTLVALRQRLAGTPVTLINTVHDSVLFSIPKNEKWREHVNLAIEIMEDVPSRIKSEFNITSPVEFPCDAEIGTAWSKTFMKSLDTAA